MARFCATVCRLRLADQQRVLCDFTSGHIAQTTAQAAKAFGMRIASIRRNPGKDDGGLLDVQFDDKAALFAESDFVVCVLPGTPETLDFCGVEEFAAMKESGVFISIGRGLCAPPSFSLTRLVQ